MTKSQLLDELRDMPDSCEVFLSFLADGTLTKITGVYIHEADLSNPPFFAVIEAANA